MPTVCQNPGCTQPGHFDSAEHLLECYGLAMESEEAEKIVEFLVSMAKITSVPNPGRPSPAGTFFEVELRMEDEPTGREVERWDPRGVMAALFGDTREEGGEGGKSQEESEKMRHWELLNITHTPRETEQ